MTPLADLLICLRFFSRLPVPATARERALGAGGLAAAAAMTPLAGAILGLGAAAVLVLAAAARLPPLVSATVAVAVAVALGGALHEDALADCADGFGGGRTRERKLAIMRDSRIGAFGATAIGLSLLLRVTALGAAVQAGRGITAVLVAAILSRTACLAPLALLPPARIDGSGAAATVARGRAAAAMLLAVLVVGAIASIAGAEIARIAAAIAAAALAGSGVTLLACREIGGQTGDVAGATQQAAEAAVLLAFAAGAG